MKPPRGRPFPKGRSGNPRGENGWTKARERLRKALEDNADDLGAVLIGRARDGDIKALQLALGPMLPAVEQKLEVEHGGAVTFRWEK